VIKERLLRLLLAVIIISALLVIMVSCIDNAQEETRASIQPTRGVWNRNVYTSAYMGLWFDMPSDWMRLTDDWLFRDVEGGIIPEETVITEEIWDRLDFPSIMDFYAESSLGANVSLSFEKVSEDVTTADHANPENFIMLGLTVSAENDGTITRIGPYDWQHFELSHMAASGEQNYIRFFINVRQGIARSILISHSQNTESVEDVLTLFGNLDEDSPPTPRAATASDDPIFDERIIGKWVWDVDNSLTYTFFEDGSGIMGYGDEAESFFWFAQGEGRIFVAGADNILWRYTFLKDTLILSSNEFMGGVVLAFLRYEK